MDATAQLSPRDRAQTLGLAALAIIVLLTLSAVLVARLTGFEPAQPELGGLVESRMLGFRDGSAGKVEIYDWDTGEDISQLEAGEGAFLRGVIRSLVRQRRGSTIPEGAPFLLARYSDGRLLVSDPDTGEDIDLIAFGPSNIAVFAALMPSDNEPKAAAYRLD